MDKTTVLYALSTLAQTCAAVAAFVGAIGLFRIQALREGRQSAERNCRSVMGRADLNGADPQTIPFEDLRRHVARLKDNPGPVHAGVLALAAYNEFGPQRGKVGRRVNE